MLYKFVEFRPFAIIQTQTTWYIFIVRRPRVIKPTPFVTGPLEVTRLDTNIRSILNILMWASARGFSFPKLLVYPKLLKCDAHYYMYVFLDASPKADGSDKIKYRYRG